MDLQDLPPEVEECVVSVKEDNPDMDKSQAVAICRDQLDMQEDGDDCPDGHVQVAGECVEIEEVDIVPPLDMSSPRVLQNGRFNDPIEREERSDGAIVYKNVAVLSEGIWTDSNSRQPTHYVPENLDVEQDATLNLIHDEGNDVSDIGFVENERDEDGTKIVDFVLHMENAASEYADENLRATLESGGAKGFGGPSVEIPGEGLEIAPDGPMGYPVTKAGKISGVALVRNQADRKVGFARQTSERAVALADGDGSQTPLVYRLKDGGMSDTAVGADALLETFDVDPDDLDLAGKDLADVPVQELVALIAESYGADPAELMSALEPFLDGDGGGEEAEMQEDDEEEEDEGEEAESDDGEEDDDGDGGDDVDINMEEEVAALQDRVQALEDMVDSLMSADALEEELEDATADLADAEAVKELAEAVEELDERARELEAEPKPPKALAGESGNGDGAEVSGRISEITPSRRRY